MLEKEYSKKQILNYTNSYLGNVRTVFGFLYSGYVLQIMSRTFES